MFPELRAEIQSPWRYTITQPSVIAHYLSLAFWPKNLVLDYGWPAAQSVRETLPCLLLIAGLMLVTAMALISFPKWGFLGAWFFVVLAPTSSVIPIPAIAFEHRMYLPLAAVVTATVIGSNLILRRLSGGILTERRRGLVSAVLLFVIVVSFATRTWRRNRDYETVITIWQDNVAKAPKNAMAHFSLANALVDAACNEQAIAEYRAALELDPKFVDARVNLGYLLASTGNLKEAIPNYLAAIASAPRDINAHNDLGLAFAALGRTDEAMAEYRTALDVDPRFAQAHYNLALCLTSRARHPEALSHYRAAALLEHDHPVILVRLAWVLATCPDQSCRNGVEAVVNARRAIELDRVASPGTLDVLAAAQAEAGQFSAARATAQDALALAVRANAYPLSEAIRSRMQLYANRKSFRDLPPP